MCSVKRLPVQGVLGLGDGVPAPWLRAQPLSTSWLLPRLPDSPRLCWLLHPSDGTAAPTLKRCFENSTEMTQEALAECPVPKK